MPNTELDRLLGGTSELDKLLESNVTSSSIPTPAVSSIQSANPELDQLLGEGVAKKDENPIMKMGKQAKELAETFYGGIVKWATTPNKYDPNSPVDLLNPLKFQENLAKGAVEVGVVAPIGLASLELGGLREWITRPKESLASLKEGPKIIKEDILLPMVEDVKEMFSNPIKYTYEKPINQLLNISIITGLGVGAKGMAEANKVSRLDAIQKATSSAILRGDEATAKLLQSSAEALSGKVSKEGLRAVSPSYNQMVEDLSYQNWLKNHAPLSGRGIKPAVERTIEPITIKGQFADYSQKQLDKLVGKMTDEAGVGMVREDLPDVYLKKNNEGFYNIHTPDGKQVGTVGYTVDSQGNAFIEDIRVDQPGKKYGVAAVEKIKQNPEVKKITGQPATPEAESWWEHNFNAMIQKDPELGPPEFIIPVREGFKTTFRNTEEAMSYGSQIKGNKGAIKALETERNSLQELIDKHKEEIVKLKEKKLTEVPETVMTDIADRILFDNLATSEEAAIKLQKYISSKVLKYWDLEEAPKKFRNKAEELAWQISRETENPKKVPIPAEKFQQGLDLAVEQQKINEALDVARATAENPSKVQTVTEHIRDSVYNKAIAGEIPPEGQLDAVNYYRYMKERASGPIKKVLIPEEYLGDYRTIKPAVEGLPKLKPEIRNIDIENTLFNHWTKNVREMKNPEHGQSFITEKYVPQGEFPKYPERIYPWISQKTKAPYPTGDVGGMATKITSPGQIMRNAWGMHNPLVDAFEAQQVAQLNVANSFKWFNTLTKGFTPVIEEVKNTMKPLFNKHIMLNQKLSLITDPQLREALGKEIAANYETAFKLQMELAKKHPDVRMSLYAQDSLPAELVQLMSTREIKTAEMVKAYYAKTGADLERVGLPTVSGKAYTRHIVGDEMKKVNGDWSKLPDYVKQYIPRDVAFAHRTSEFDWYPSLLAGMDNYIPIVERKVAMQAYLNHWRDTIDVAARSGNKAAQEASNMIIRNMTKTQNIEQKASSVITRANYFLQLFGNARVAVKHLIGGLPGSVSEVGPFTSLKALSYMVTHPFQSAEMMKTYAKLGDIVKTLDMTNQFETHANRFWKGLQVQPTAAAEYLENGINIIGNMIRAGSKEFKGIDPQLVRDYIWNKVTSVNFRGGWDIPNVFASPVGRVAFQYSLEPHKVWEYRIELVKRALNGEKDIFGSSYGSKLVQYITITGAMEMLARSYGKTIVDTIGGTPYIDFISPTSEAPYFKIDKPKVKLGPGVKLLADASAVVARGDIGGMLDYFVDYGLESGVGILGQIMKVGTGKYPDTFSDPISYLLGLPEVDILEKKNAKSHRFMEYRSEVEELNREKNLIRKNPMLKHLVIFKRDFRKKIKDFANNPSKYLEAISNQNQVPESLEGTVEQYLSQ